MAWGTSSIASQPPPLPSTEDPPIPPRPSSQSQALDRKPNMWDRFSLHRLSGWLRRDESDALPPAAWEKAPQAQAKPQQPGSRKRSRTVVPGLPRHMTFKRQELEKRERLIPAEPGHSERRAFSADRRDLPESVPRRPLSPPPRFPLRQSAPDSLRPFNNSSTQESLLQQFEDQKGGKEGDNERSNPPQSPWGHPPPLSAAGDISDDALSESADAHIIQQELDAKWILNLSMHFRDMSDREKFFVTYAEEPNRWRRVTISIDYRGVPEDSLEADLKSLHYQRDKSARIYESIRDSLLDIQFYETVTNLKLQTDDGRLHVHVTEDMNEIIPYPSTSAVAHLDCRIFHESDVHFESHLSGFVYKISVAGQIYIKKEIPGPEAVEEFLYEINTLSRLRASQCVIKFAGIITDDREDRIVGLLISYAEKGALVDLLYDWKETKEMLWPRRERWAKQIVRGLSEIHESGFVQGDFTLSNIVIDSNDDAKIIDINRRGCPVGWEPPELSQLIESGQRIGIYIGVKSDLFQLGMVLWALAEEQDEPERQERPLEFTIASDGVPSYFKDIVEACLSPDPRDRPSAKALLSRFPDQDNAISRPGSKSNARHSVMTHRSDKEYIDPKTAVDHEDIDQHRRNHVSTEPADPPSLVPSTTFSYVGPPTDYEAESSGSYVIGGRGRSLGDNGQHYTNSPIFSPPSTSAMSFVDSEVEPELASPPPENEPPWQQVYVDGSTRLVQRDSFKLEDHDFGTQEQATVCISTPTMEANTPFPVDPLEAESAPQVPPVSDYPDLAGLQDMPPSPPLLPYRRTRLLRNNGSFQDRASQDNILADLANEVQFHHREQMDDPLSRVFRFSPPVHQDSGFDEPPAPTVGDWGDFNAEEVFKRRSGLEHDLDLELCGMIDSSGGAEKEEEFFEGKLGDDCGGFGGEVETLAPAGTGEQQQQQQQQEERLASNDEGGIDVAAPAAAAAAAVPAAGDEHGVKGGTEQPPLSVSSPHPSSLSKDPITPPAPAPAPTSAPALDQHDHDPLSPTLSSAEAAVVGSGVEESVFDHLPTRVMLQGVRRGDEGRDE